MIVFLGLVTAVLLIITIMNLIKYLSFKSRMQYDGVPISESKNEDGSATYEIAVDRGEKTSTFQYRVGKNEEPLTLNQPIKVMIDSRRPSDLMTQADLDRMKKNAVIPCAGFAAALIITIIVANFS